MLCHVIINDIVKDNNEITFLGYEFASKILSFLSGNFTCVQVVFTLQRRIGNNKTIIPFNLKPSFHSI